MAKTNNTAKTIASGAAPKTAKKKTTAKKAEAIIENVVTEVKEEATEEVGTFSVQRWQVILVAAAITLGTLIIVL